MSQVLKQFCYCFSLPSGCIVIGGIEGLIGLLALFAYTTTPTKGTDSSALAHAMLIGMAMTNIFNSILLIIGTLNKRPLYLAVWLTFMAISMVTFSFYTLFVAFVPGTLLIDILSLAIETYFWFVVFSFYMEIQNASDALNLEILYQSNPETEV